MPSGTALVVGGTGGIGRAVVEALLADGRHVALTFRSDEATAESLVRAGGPSLRAHRLDHTEPAAVEALVENVESDLGPLEALVNCAGVASSNLLGLTSEPEWARVIDANLGGVFRCCRAVIPGMLRRRRGSIVNVASLAAIHGRAGQTAYAASKAGVVGLTRALAREVGRRNIRVNAVAPGFLLTKMTEGLTAEEVEHLRQGECLPEGVRLDCVARTVRFLLSEDARSITGQCIVVDAGISA